jgi:hypothetical protein
LIDIPGIDLLHAKLINAETKVFQNVVQYHGVKYKTAD